MVEANEEDDDDAPPKKKRKQLTLNDPCHVWRISKYTEKPTESEEDDLPVELGGRLAQFTPGAWLNAMVGLPLVKKSLPSSKMIQESAKTCGEALTFPQYNKPGNDLEQYMSQVWEMAQAAVQTDIWCTTPFRIQQRLAPELPAQEFATIRKRIYDTVILGKDSHVNEEEDDTPVAMGSQLHESEKYKKCPNCGNMDQSLFALDQKNGDIIFCGNTMMYCHCWVTLLLEEDSLIFQTKRTSKVPPDEKTQLDTSNYFPLKWFLIQIYLTLKMNTLLTFILNSKLNLVG